MKSSVNKRIDSISRASVIQFGARIITVLVQVGFTAVLARLLTPEEYGVVAIITVFVGFFAVLSDFGISTAVIQYTDLSKEDHEALFFVSMVLAIILSVIFVGISFGIAFIYQDTLYISLGIVLIPAIIFNALNMVPNGILVREKLFLSIGVRAIVTTIVAGVVTVVLALNGLGVYAIALDSVLASASVFVWNEWHVKLKPRCKGSLIILRSVGRYSVFRFGDQAIVYFASNLDSLLCGKFFGSQNLGYYNKAYMLAGMPGTYLISTITSTLHPFFTELKDDLDALWDRFRNVIKVVSLVSVFCCVQMFTCSRELILILFGDQWIPSILLLQILAFWIYPRSLNSVHAPLLLAMDRSDLLFLSTSINTIITIAMIILGIGLGSVDAMARCVTAAYFLELIVPVFLCIKRCLKRSVLRYVSAFIPELAAGAISLLSVEFLLPCPESVILALVTKLCSVTIIFLGSCLLFGQGRYVRNAWHSLRGGRS